MKAILCILTDGMDEINMATHVVAGMREASETTPATMAPTIPPTSNSVERSALSSALKSVESFIYLGSQNRKV